MSRLDELVQTIRDGHPPESDIAFRSLYDDHKRLVYNVVWPFANRDAELAMDLVQETFTRLWTAIREGRVKVETDRDLRALVVTIARNLGNDEVRRRQAKKRPALEYSMSPPEIEVPPAQEQRLSFLSTLAEILRVPVSRKRMIRKIKEHLGGGK